MDHIAYFTRRFIMLDDSAYGFNLYAAFMELINHVLKGITIFIHNQYNHI